jgi:hypothetical protein
VDQVSKPVLIALAAVLVFVVAHFTVLAPKTSSGPAPAPQAPGQQGLENAIGKANNAVAQSKSSANRTEQAAAAASGDSTASASKPAATPAAKKASAAKPAAAPAKPLPKLAKGDRSGPMLRNLSNGKVVVALFYNPHGADDNAALRAVRTADRHHGKVIVHSIPVDHVGDYDALTTGVQVLQAPTILVIGPNFKARTIVGYTEVKEVDQMVGDVGGRGFTARPAKHLTGWAAKASEICKDNGFRIQTSGTPTSSGELAPYLTHATKLEGRSRSRTAAVAAVGAKQKAAKAALLNAYDTDLAALASARAKLRAGAAPGPVVYTLLSEEAALVKHARPALHAVHERHCLG